LIQEATASQPDCLKQGQPGHGVPYNWKGGGRSNDRGKGKLFNRKPNLRKE